MSALSGKVALVTGGASGIGAACVRRLVADGAAVVSTDLNDGAGRAAAGEAGADFLQQDIADPARWAEVVNSVVAKHGRLDILVNNAGVTVGKSIEDVDLDSWNRGLAVLLTGPMLGCQNAIRVMKANPGGASGAIINVASTTAIAALPHDVTYTSAKSGLRMLTKSVAVYCAQRGYAIRCNTLIPGATDTAILQPLPEDVRDIVAAPSPMNRLGQPSELAAAVAFLAADDCSFMTGAELLVDGGALAVHPGF